MEQLITLPHLNIHVRGDWTISGPCCEIGWVNVLPSSLKPQLYMLPVIEKYPTNWKFHGIKKH